VIESLGTVRSKFAARCSRIRTTISLCSIVVLNHSAAVAMCEGFEKVWRWSKPQAQWEVGRLLLLSCSTGRSPEETQSLVRRVDGIHVRSCSNNEPGRATVRLREVTGTKGPFPILEGDGTLIEIILAGNFTAA
jgi:hypothetical protein